MPARDPGGLPCQLVILAAFSTPHGKPDKNHETTATIAEKTKTASAIRYWFAKSYSTLVIIPRIIFILVDTKRRVCYNHDILH
jgi:hypothetical protein